MEKLVLIFLFLGLFLCAPQLSWSNQEAQLDQPQPQVLTRTIAPMAPHWELVIKDAGLLEQIVKHNKWYQEFYQSLLYQGFVMKLSPILYSLADEYGEASKSWKGRLLDYFYGRVMAGHPLMLSYFNKNYLSSPLGLTILELSSSEKTVIEALIKAFRLTTDQEVILSADKKVAVTPILIRGQRFALVLNNSCFSISRDAKVAATSNERCVGVKLAKGDDGRVTVNLAQQFPSFNGLREKFFATQELVQIGLHWNSIQYRFEARDATLQMNSELTPLQKGKLSSNVMKALPASTVFYATIQIPNIENLSKEGMKSYLKTELKLLKKKKPTSVTLFYAPLSVMPSQSKANEGNETTTISSGESSASSTSSSASSSVGLAGRSTLSSELKLFSGILIERPENDGGSSKSVSAGVVASGATSKLTAESKGQSLSKMMEDLSQLLNGKKKGEVFFRPLCGDVFVLSNHLELVKLVDDVCRKKQVSFSEVPEKWGMNLTKTNFSAATYFSPGKVLSKYIEIGWQQRKSMDSKGKGTGLPEELIQSQKVVEALGDQLFYGIVDAKKLVFETAKQ